MRQRPKANKANKFNEEQYFNQKDPKDKAKKKRVAEIYKEQTLPKSRHPNPRNKQG